MSESMKHIHWRVGQIAEASCGNGECPYGPCQTGDDSCSCKSGVSTAPGASTLSRMPALAHPAAPPGSAPIG